MQRCSSPLLVISFISSLVLACPSLVCNYVCTDPPAVGQVITVPSSQAVGGCEQGAGPCTRVRVFFLFAVFSKCRKSRLVFLLSTGQSKQKRNLDKEEASAKTHMYTGTRRLSTHLLACTHTHARVLTLTHTPEYNGPCEFPHYWFNPSSV